MELLSSSLDISTTVSPQFPKGKTFMWINAETRVVCQGLWRASPVVSRHSCSPYQKTTPTFSCDFNVTLFPHTLLAPPRFPLALCVRPPQRLSWRRSCTTDYKSPETMTSLRAKLLRHAECWSSGLTFPWKALRPQRTRSALRPRLGVSASCSNLAILRLLNFSAVS